MLRTEALTKLAAGQGNIHRKILVSYPEAIFEKVVLPSTLSSNIIHIKTGDTLDTDRLLLQLADYGFERTDFVYEPGQFAIRGGILDIYSFGNEKPYRVELFGHEVDSIRIVDPETQLSERKLLQVSIIPNVDTRFESSERISLLDFLPENTIVWMQDYALCTEHLTGCEEELESFLRFKETSQSQKSKEAYDDTDDKLLKKTAVPDDFISVRDFESKAARRHIVSFGHHSGLPSGGAPLTIAFSTKEQPAFNRQFDLLIRDLKSWEAKKFTLYIFAENPKQLERLQTIFDELPDGKAGGLTEVVFNPIPVSIHEGFIDEDLQIVCYTDHQVFQRYHKYKVKQAYNKEALRQGC